MEESEKRKERLRAMRMEAARAESSDHSEALPTPSSLANPFAETAGPLSGQEELRAAPRFNYYTDPASAFSADKRRNNFGTHAQQNYPSPNLLPYSTAPSPSVAGPTSFETVPSPHAYQWQPRYPPNNTMYQPHTPPPNPIPYQGPRTSALPSPLQGVPPQAWNDPNFHHQYNNAPSGYSQNPNFGQSGRPNFSPRHGGPQWRGYTPRPIGPGPNFGRGRPQWSGPGGSPSPGRIGGRGGGFHGRGSGGGRPMGPERFYHESMIEDPWKDMVAVVWTPVGAPSTSSWMPQSVRQKKPRITESPNKFGGGLNLAEFLAATFKETTNETETTPETGESDNAGVSGSPLKEVAN